MGSDEGRKPRDDPRRNPAFLLFLALATSSTVALFFSLLPTPSPSPHTLSSTTNLLSSRSSSSISSPPLPLVVILVTPSPVEGPGSRFDRLKVIHQTWGSRQPAHVKVLFTTDSLKEDGGNGVLPSSSFLLLPEAYPPKDNMHRIQYSLEEGSRLFPMAEFFLVCNDHTFIIPENLLCYLSTYRDASPSTSTTTTTPLFLGHRLTTTEGTSFHSGGAGFVLNRAATDALLSALTAPKPAPNCQAHNEWEAINAGVTMAKCLTYTLEIPPTDTRDEKGGQRFHVFGPARTAEGKVDEWFVNYHPDIPSFPVVGMGCCAEDSVSFHYVGPAEAEAIHHLLYHQQEFEHNRSAAHELWPRTMQEVGGYSALPSSSVSEDGRGAMWDVLLEKIKICDI